MKVINGLAPGVIRISKRTADISKEAKKRLSWFDFYEAHGRNARKTCRHFGISPDTFYWWKKRYDPKNLRTLDDRSHRPRHVRQPTWSMETSEAVLKLREEYPRWGKEKVAVLLNERGYRVSASMVGRILKRLKDRGILKEPIANSISTRKQRRKRPMPSGSQKTTLPKSLVIS